MEGVEEDMADNIDVVMEHVMEKPCYHSDFGLIDCAIIKYLTAEPLKMCINPPPPKKIS